MNRKIERYTADEINMLILNRDPVTLSYFHLENASDRELLYFDARGLPEEMLPIKSIIYDPPDSFSF